MRRQPDLVLYTVAILLLATGVVFIYSASYARAAPPTSGQTAAAAATANRAAALVDTQQTVMRRQLGWAWIGLLCFFAAYLIPYEVLRSRAFARFVLGFAVVLLVLVLHPSLGRAQGRASMRWLTFGPVSLQPSEVAKVALCIYLAHALARLRHFIREPEIFARVFLLVNVVAGLILKEPHLGGTLVLVGSAMLMLHVAGADLRHLAAVLLVGAVIVGWSISAHTYQQGRLQAWLDPAASDLDVGYQAVHCGTALARGRLLGRGLGRSIEKFYYLPECYTDSILAIYGEELGLLGTSLLLLLFLIYGWRGLRIAYRCRDPFGRYLAVGLTGSVFGQALLNYGVTSGLLPQTGVGLPFISYGGSALCCFMAATGLLLNVSRQLDAAGPLLASRGGTG